MGPAIISVLDQFDLSDLQKKSIRSVLDSVQYNPSLTTKKSIPSTETVTVSQPLLSLNEPSDISTEVVLAISCYLVGSDLAGFTYYRR